MRHFSLYGKRYIHPESRDCEVVNRGVQYVHWMMHKCIMVKEGGKRNTHKVCKKQVNFSKTGGKFFKVERK